MHSTNTLHYVSICVFLLIDTQREPGKIKYNGKLRQEC